MFIPLCVRGKFLVLISWKLCPHVVPSFTVREHGGAVRSFNLDLGTDLGTDPVLGTDLGTDLDFELGTDLETDLDLVTDLEFGTVVDLDLDIDLGTDLDLVTDPDPYCSEFDHLLDLDHSKPLDQDDRP